MLGRWYARSIMVALTAVVVLSYPVQVLGEAQPGASTIERDPPRDIDPGPVPLPEPVPPAVAATAEDGFQFVGFTSRGFCGNKGILNYTLACQREFYRSRMCAIEEIRRTLEVPRVAAPVWAWARNEGAVPLAESREAHVSSGVSLKIPTDDCNGWISGSADDHGIAVELGPEAGCSGGLWAVACNEELPVACCALPEKE